MVKARVDDLEREYWRWRLRLTRVAALLPASMVTGASSFFLLLAHRMAHGPEAGAADGRAHDRPC
jgi:hypothetical protein